MPSFDQVDFHIHTCRSDCADSANTVAAIARTAPARGLQIVGLSDHIHRPEHLDRILHNMKAVVDHGDAEPRLFVGCEVDLIRPGRLAVDGESLALADYVMVVPNHFFIEDVADPPDDTPEGLASYWLDMVASLCDMPVVNVVGHPNRCGMFRDVLGSKMLTEFCPPDRLERLLKLLAGRGLALELNAIDFAELPFEPHVEFYRLCVEYAVPIAIGSDSHVLERIGETVDLAPLVQAAGITDEHLWMPPEACAIRNEDRAEPE